MKKIKRLLICFLALLTVCSIATAVACSKKVTLVGWNNESINVEFGSVYLADAVATDADGNEYETSVKVTDNEGNNVEVISRKFPVVKKGYKVVYTAQIGKETYKKTDTLTVIAGQEPMIEFDNTVQAILLGESYTVPTPKAYDYFDGEISCSTAIYMAGATAAEDTLMSNDETFTATETGKYYVKYSATNSADMTTEETLNFYVRSAATAGEWDSFDDEGAIYNTQINSAVSGFTWHSEFNGRSGVIQVFATENDAYATSFAILPKIYMTEETEEGKSGYVEINALKAQGYTKLVLNMYFDGEENALQNFRFCHPNVSNTPIQPVYGSWATYVFDATGIYNNWANFARNKTTTSTNGYFTGTYLKDCEIYIDDIYFAKPVETLGGTGLTESENTVTADYSYEDQQLAYAVSFDEKSVSVNGNSFTAEYAGTYIVTPTFINSNEYVYVGEPIKYESQSEYKLKVNDFDQSVSLNANDGEYVLPTATVIDGSGGAVDGFMLSATTIFRDYAGNVSQTAFSTAKKGWYEYIITAKKDGEKTLYKNVSIRVGDYIDGEIFNVSDKDAANRVGAMLMGASFSQVDGEDISETYKGNTYLKLSVNLSNNYLSTGYFNFRPYATADEVVKEYDVVKLRFFVKATYATDVTESIVTTTVFGTQKTQLNINDWTEITVSAQAYANVYYRLCESATWGDYAATFNITYKDFTSFAIYMDNVVGEKVEMPKNLIVFEQNNYTRAYNSDIDTLEYVSAEQLVDLGHNLNGYTGNAVKWTYSGNNSGFKITLDLSARQLNMFTDYYKEVVINFCVTSEIDAYTLLCDGLVELAYGGNYQFNSTNYGTWVTLKISAQDFVDYAKGNSSLQLFRTYVGESGVRQIYFGDITYVEIPATQNPTYDNEGSDIDWNI